MEAFILLKTRRVLYRNTKFFAEEDDETRVGMSPSSIENAMVAICSFLNSPSGGVVYVGVTDDGMIRGVPIADDEKDEMIRLYTNKLKRFWPELSLQQLDSDLLSICWLPVFRSSKHPSPEQKPVVTAGGSTTVNPTAGGATTNAAAGSITPNAPTVAAGAAPIPIASVDGKLKCALKCVQKKTTGRCQVPRFTAAARLFGCCFCSDSSSIVDDVDSGKSRLVVCAMRKSNPIDRSIRNTPLNTAGTCPAPV